MPNLEILKSPEFKLFIKKTFSGDTASYHFFNMMPIGLSITTDISGKEIRHNPKAASFFRIKDWSTLSHSASNIAHLKILRNRQELLPEELPVQRALWLGKDTDREEHEFVWEDGVRKFALCSSRPIRNDNGLIIGAIAVTEDITEHKLMEEEKLATENRYLNYLEKMLEYFAVFRAMRNENGQIIDFIAEYINEAGRQDRNVTKNEYMGKNMSVLFPDYVESGLFKSCCHVIETGNPIEIDKFCYINVKKPNITEVYEGRIIKQDNEKVSLSGRNITEKKKLENEIRRLDRLNIVGEMAASIGHEIRNPLTTVRGYLQMFEMKNECARYKEQFSTMIEELDRANSIITEFLSLAKNKVIIFERTNVNEIIHALSPLLQADALHRGIEIKVELDDIPAFDLDDKEIRQLIMNLVRNAEEAIVTNGTIVIKTGLAEGQVFLSVQDSGPGIPKDILDKLGTPFFTTKDTGTGLGLSVCYRIADRHNAKIEIKTGPDGTTFFVKFRQMSAPPDLPPNEQSD